VRLYRQSELRTLPRPKFLVPHYLLEHTLAQMSGLSGAGKTFVYTDWCCRLAVEGRKVLVILGEGLYGYQSRLDAWQTHHDVEVPNNNLIVLADIPALPSFEQMSALITQVKKLGVLDLITVDTFAKAMSGYDEKDAADVTVALSNLAELRRVAGGATGLLVTHFGWEATRQRGSSALYGECDTVIYLKKVTRKNLRKSQDEDDALDSLGYLDVEDEPRSKRVRLCLEKQRDAPDDVASVTLERTDVPLGYPGPDGEPAVSCVYLPIRLEPRVRVAASSNGNGHAKVIDLTSFLPD
jgi:hypothetical protein